LMMIATHFQAIGSATYAAVLGLTKPYLFAMPLTLLLPLWIGEIGIWYAGPIAEIMLLTLTVVVLRLVARREQLRWGLFASV
jgi:Na+-driven multidrug efflux pump